MTGKEWVKGMVEEAVKLHPLEDLYSLEYSEYSDKNNKYPWHVTWLWQAIEANITDCLHGNREENKWQIVFIGSQDDCHKVLDILEGRKDVSLASPVPGAGMLSRRVVGLRLRHKS